MLLLYPLITVEEISLQHVTQSVSYDDYELSVNFLGYSHASYRIMTKNINVLIFII